MIKRTAAIALALYSACSIAEIHYLNPWEGLPNYDKNPAFVGHDANTIKTLKATIQATKVAPKDCVIGNIKVQKDWNVPLRSNICEANQFKNLMALVVRLAPALATNTTLHIIDAGAPRGHTLLVAHYDLNQDPYVGGEPYPFLSLWRLRFKGDDYDAPHAGGFLDGSIFDHRAFGPQGRVITFVRHVSCIECEPFVYLTGIDFDGKPDDATVFEFNYSDSPDGFGATIEYELPGMGHSIDAKVESRTLPPSPNGPHLLQSFKMEAGDDSPDEWWMFACRDYRCDYKMFTGNPPPEFLKLWTKAKAL